MSVGSPEQHRPNRAENGYEELNPVNLLTDLDAALVTLEVKDRQLGEYNRFALYCLSGLPRSDRPVEVVMDRLHRRYDYQEKLLQPNDPREGRAFSVAINSGRETRVFIPYITEEMPAEFLIFTGAGYESNLKEVNLQSSLPRSYFDNIIPPSDQRQIRRLTRPQPEPKANLPKNNDNHATPAGSMETQPAQPLFLARSAAEWDPLLERYEQLRKASANNITESQKTPPDTTKPSLDELVRQIRASKLDESGVVAPRPNAQPDQPQAHEPRTDRQGAPHRSSPTVPHGMNMPQQPTQPPTAEEYKPEPTPEPQFRYFDDDERTPEDSEIVVKNSEGLRTLVSGLGTKKMKAAGVLVGLGLVGWAITPGGNEVDATAPIVGEQAEQEAVADTSAADASSAKFVWSPEGVCVPAGTYKVSGDMYMDARYKALHKGKRWYPNGGPDAANFTESLDSKWSIQSCATADGAVTVARDGDVSVVTIHQDKLTTEETYMPLTGDEVICDSDGDGEQSSFCTNLARFNVKAMKSDNVIIGGFIAPKQAKALNHVFQSDSIKESAKSMGQIAAITSIERLAGQDITAMAVSGLMSSIKAQAADQEVKVSIKVDGERPSSLEGFIHENKWKLSGGTKKKVWVKGDDVRLQDYSKIKVTKVTEE